MQNLRTILHVDFDYFYAQCEEIRDPILKSKPVCVCVFSDRGEDRGAVATANYTARKFGARSGIPISFAKRYLKGKDAVFLPVDFEYYQAISDKAMNVMAEYADIFEYVGRDEAYLDVTKRTSSQFENARRLGQQLKNAIRAKTSLGCSVGVSPNKLVSKIASDYQKPDGLTLVTPEKVEKFLEGLDIKAIPGIGKKTLDRLSEKNLKTITDLKKMDVFALSKEFGRKSGTYIYNAVRGIDDEPVKKREPSTQYSKIVTLKQDSKDYEFLAANIATLCKAVCDTAKKNNRVFRSVGIHFVQSDLTSRSKSRMLKKSTQSLAELEKTAHQLLKDALESQEKDIRRLGVKVSELSEIEGQSNITNYF